MWEQECIQTPSKVKTENKLIIPPSPFMKKLGYGTGVCVYEFTRSPISEKLRSPWAIKKIIKKRSKDLELNKRLKLEAEHLKQLCHPNIVGFRAFVKSQRGDILAMEECHSSLGDIIEQKRESGETNPLLLNIITKVGHDISSALNYLHNIALLLHCDIKSYNILVKNDFEICKLCDFGVCMPLNSDGMIDEDKVEKEYEYTGTLAWSAPEVLKFPQEITTKADVYSFGLVLYEMLTLSVPVNEEVMMEMTDSSSVTPDESFSMFQDNGFILPSIDLSEEYDIILELMSVCVSSDMHKRPSAQDLELIFVKLLKN